MNASDADSQAAAILSGTNLDQSLPAYWQLEARISRALRAAFDDGREDYREERKRGRETQAIATEQRP